MVRPRTLVGIAIVGVVLYGFPGLMSYDSVFQLDEARRWDLGDAHPPAMAALWRLVEVFVAGPFGMLLLQTTALAAGLYLILSTELAPRRAAIAALAICWFPPVLVVMGVIWKDSQMAGYLMLGIAALMSPRRAVRYLGLAALIVAGAMRHNAPAATCAPVILLWGARELQWWRRWLVPVGVWIAITVASFGITRALAQHHRAMWADSVALADVVGTIRYADPMTDDELRTLLAGAPLKVDHDIQHQIAVHYHPQLYLEDQPDDPIRPPTTAEEAAALSRAWRELVTHRPLAYLHHRWTIYQRILNLRGHTVPTPTTSFTYKYDPVLAGRVSHDASPSLIQRGWFWLVRAISGVWYAPFVYFVIALALLAFARSRLVFALLGSGLLYELGLFPFALNPDYRYSHWLIVSTTVALVLVIARRAQGPASR